MVGLPESSQTADRCLHVLKLVSDHEPVRFSDLRDILNYSPAVLRRLVVSLMNAQMIRQTRPNGPYVLGHAAYAMGQRQGGDAQVIPEDIARETVSRLAELSGDTAFLSVRAGFSTKCILRIEGAHPIRTHVLQQGDHHPLGLGAAAIAILGALDPDEADYILGVNESRIQSYHEPLDMAMLKGLIETARAVRVSVNPGLVFPGSWAIAAAVRNSAGQPIAALTIAAIEARMTPPRQVELAKPLLAEVDRLETYLAAAQRAPNPMAPKEHITA